MTEIRKLDPETRARIAAGEVVQRPANVVTELIENALDAGADRIEVAVDGDGTDRIRVTDDGRGIPAEAAPLALERHATSKIRDADDLSRAETLGFRGEALPSIATAAGRLELATSAGADPGGVRVVAAGGERTVETAGHPQGTTVEVTDLFSDRPARRKALASPATEFGRISDAVTRYALANPDVRFRLTHDGRETFATPGTELTDAVLGIYDRTVAARSTTFDHEATPTVDGEQRTVAVAGLLAYPSVTRTRPSHVYTGVNGRGLVVEVLRNAVVDGYGTLLPDGRYPVAAVSVTLPPELVDQNVHPAKRDVSFRDPAAVADAVESAVRDALATTDLRRSGELAMDLETSLAPVDGEESVFAEADVLGQFRGLYLLCAAGDDLLVVDQHAAHERVNYERLRTAVGDVERRPVDPPETVTLSPAGAAAVESHADALADLGFEIEPFGGTTVRLTAAPAPLGRVADADAFRDAVDTLREGDDPDDVRDDLLTDLACHPSLKAGDELTDEAASRLVERLGACEQPYACPHGRPTVLSIDEETLVRGFERSHTRRGE
jgi:DNA mismatch repair protein MutL